MNLFLAFFAIHGIVFTFCVWAIRETSEFLRLHPQMADRRALARFKTVARANMKLALVVMALLATGLVLGVFIVSQHLVLGLIVVVAVNLLSLGVSLYLRQIEKQSQNLPTPDEAIAREYQQVVNSWERKALPDF